MGNLGCPNLMERVLAYLQEVKYYGKAVLLSLEAPGVAAEAVPGQFVQVLCGRDSPRVLRRPFSIFSAKAGRILLLSKVVGKGTSWLAELKAGEQVDLIGPLGRGFAMDEGDRPALVAGGAGIAPLHFLAERLMERRTEPSLYWGLDLGEEFGELPALLGKRFRLFMCSRDGCLGERGTVVEALAREKEPEFNAVYACGPREMLGALAKEIKGANLPFQLSLEERMACGVGACQGCAVPIRSARPAYSRVCKDGPVFRFEEIDWRAYFGGS